MVPSTLKEPLLRKGPWVGGEEVVQKFFGVSTRDFSLKAPLTVTLLRRIVRATSV